MNLSSRLLFGIECKILKCSVAPLFLSLNLAYCAIDTLSETHIIENLKNRKGRTLYSNNLSSVADHIMIIEQGSIVNQEITIIFMPIKTYIKHDIFVKYNNKGDV